MSKQLAVSAAFSIFMMAVYVLLGAGPVRHPLGFDSPSVEVSAPALADTKALLPFGD